jgi:hypothetical protein
VVQYYEHEARQWFLSVIPAHESHAHRAAELRRKGKDPDGDDFDYDVAVPGTVAVNVAVDTLLTDLRLGPTHPAVLRLQNIKRRFSDAGKSIEASRTALRNGHARLREGKLVDADILFADCLAAQVIHPPSASPTSLPRSLPRLSLTVSTGLAAQVMFLTERRATFNAEVASCVLGKVGRLPPLLNPCQWHVNLIPRPPRLPSLAGRPTACARKGGTTRRTRCTAAPPWSSAAASWPTRPPRASRAWPTDAAS